jgi:hypothetical protein
MRKPTRPARIIGEGYSDDLKERKRLYRSRRWQRVRANHLARNPHCASCLRDGICTPARVVDHVLGHLDPDWRLRFWSGPFESLCIPCHNRKCGHETAAHRWTAGGGSETSRTPFR